MKKKDLWIIVAAALCAAALLVGAKFVESKPRQGQLGLPDGATLEFTDVTPTASGRALSWLFASACAEEDAQTQEADAAEADAEEADAEEADAAETEPAEADAEEADAGSQEGAAYANLDEETVAALEEWGMEVAESYLIVWMGDYFQPIPLIEKYDGQLLRVARTEADYNVVEIGVNRFDMHEATCPDQVCLTEGEVTLENRNSRLLGSYIICMPNNVVLELKTPEELLDLLAQSTVE